LWGITRGRAAVVKEEIEIIECKRGKCAQHIDPEGMTTEFIRCPGPTESGVVAKITRTKV